MKIGNVCDRIPQILNQIDAAVLSHHILYHSAEYSPNGGVIISWRWKQLCTKAVVSLYRDSLLYWVSGHFPSTFPPGHFPQDKKLYIS